MAPVQVVAFMSYVWDHFKWSIAWGMDRTGSSALVHELCVGPVQLIDLMLHVPTLLNRSRFGGSTACAGRLKSSVQQVRHIEHVRDRLNRSTSDGMRETSSTREYSSVRVPPDWSDVLFKCPGDLVCIHCCGHGWLC